MGQEIIFSEEQLAAVAFVGDTLGPLFLYDPKLESESVAPLLAALSQIDPAAAAADWPFAGLPDAKDALHLMKAGLSAGAEDEALVSEFRRLFVGPATKVAPPWGSVYTDKENVMFGRTTLLLRAWLRAKGISVSEGNENLPEDHVGVMLGLMSWICRNCPENLAEYLSHHLLTWAPHFFERVEAKSVHPFYQGAAKLARISLEGMRREFGLQVDKPEFFL